MIFSKALLAKGLGGLAMVGTGSLGIISTKLYLDNKVTRFDQGLIDHLGKEIGGDIKFSVKNESNDIDNNFPSFTGSTNEKTATIKVKIKTSGTGGTDEGTITEKNGTDSNNESLGSKKYLQKLNGNGEGTEWTWICELKFVKSENSGTELKDKEKLVKDSTDKGFFNKLKEDGNQPLKQTFIKNCAGERGFRKNWEISGASSLTDNNEIKSTKEFKLKVGSDSKLEFENQSEFENWFNNPKDSN